MKPSPVNTGVIMSKQAQATSPSSQATDAPNGQWLRDQNLAAAASVSSKVSMITSDTPINIGHIWWRASDQAEADAMKSDLLAKGVFEVRMSDPDSIGYLDLFFTLDRDRADEILDYAVGEEEWLDPADYFLVKITEGLVTDSSATLDLAMNCLERGLTDEAMKILRNLDGKLGTIKLTLAQSTPD
jgi:hypothetical protein